MTTIRHFLTLVALITLSTVSVSGQFWNKPDAQYTFSLIYPGPPNEIELGFRQLTIDSDTLIDGKLFKRYREYAVTYDGFWWQPYSPSNLDTVSQLTSIAFYEEDSVLYGHHVNLNSNDIDTLYDFGAVQGESWTIPQRFLNALDPWNYYCDSMITVTVLDTGHIQYQGSSLYFLHVEYYGLENYASSSTDTIFERFGSKRFGFLSVSKHCYENGPPAMQDGAFYEFSCYNDNQISLGENCFEIAYLGVSEKERNVPSVYPNPAAEYVTVKTESEFISVKGLLGNLLGRFNVLNGEIRIDLSEFSDGLYIIQSENGGASRLIVQH